MNRSIRCIHGMDRDLVRCPGCGDLDNAADAGNGHRLSSRKAVVNKRTGPRLSGRERMAYARRERRGL